MALKCNRRKENQGVGTELRAGGGGGLRWCSKYTVMEAIESPLHTTACPRKGKNICFFFEKVQRKRQFEVFFKKNMHIEEHIFVC
jgi:hypothetical protein